MGGRVMLVFFRDGFYRDMILLLIVTVLVGAAFAQGIAWAIDAYFGDTLDQMLGEYGEYDLILHIREEAKEAALRELQRIGEQSFPRSEEHTSELQSRPHLVCRLLLEKKKKKKTQIQNEEK